MKTLTFSSRVPKFLLLTAISVVMCLIASSGIQAQSSKVNSGLYDIPKGPYVEADLAILRLDAELNTLKTQMLALNPGTQSYKVVEWKYVFYHSIRDRLVDGREVRDAIVTGLGIYVTDMYGDAPESQKLQHKNAVVQLLIL